MESKQADSDGCFFQSAVLMFQADICYTDLLWKCTSQWKWVIWCPEHWLFSFSSAGQ